MALHGVFAAPREPSRGAGARDGATRPTVLVVDDDTAVRDATAFMLASFGYDAVGAGDADGARALFEQESFVAVVTDLSMPGGGRRWLAELRATRPDLPVIIVTALDAEASAFATVANLADAVLRKPVDAQVLVAVLRRALG